MNLESLQEQLRQQAQTIAQQGAQVREKISELSAGAADQFYGTAEGLVGLTRAVMNGAAEGARQATARPEGAVLREVIQGLSEGLGKSALALQLTLAESQSQGARFAREDLEHAASDFRQAAEMLAEVAGTAAGRLGMQAADQAREMAEHARKSLEALRPPLEAALDAAKEHPVNFSKAAWHTGAAAARHATGTLFKELAARLDRTGERLHQREPA